MWREKYKRNEKFRKVLEIQKKKILSFQQQKNRKN